MNGLTIYDIISSVEDDMETIEKNRKQHHFGIIIDTDWLALRYQRLSRIHIKLVRKLRVKLGAEYNFKWCWFCGMPTGKYHEHSIEYDNNKLFRFLNQEGID